MKLSAILAPLIAAGVSGEIILETVKAFEEQQADAIARRRESDRLRQQRRRHVTSRDVTVTERDTPHPDKERSPIPPKEINPTPHFLERERERNVLDLEDFRMWFAAWPTSLTDDEAEAKAEWAKLTSEDRAAARSQTPNFIEEVKASGRTKWPAAAKFLAKRLWERMLEKPQRTGKPDGRDAMLRGFDSIPQIPEKPPPKTPEERAAARAAYLQSLRAHNDSW